jgi:hypothetical protein
MITKMTFTYHDIFFSFFYLVYIGLVLLGINRLLDGFIYVSLLTFWFQVSLLNMLC